MREDGQDQVGSEGSADGAPSVSGEGLARSDGLSLSSLFGMAHRAEGKGLDRKGYDRAMNCIDCGVEVVTGPRCHRCAAQVAYQVEKRDADILLMVGEGMSYRQIAERLGVTRSRVGQRVKRARERA
jgi:DNA-binding CsgD family transcriptional regulator